MTTFEAGQSITRALVVTDSAGNAADTGNMPTCLVTRPDATTVAATVVKTSTGNYTATATSTLPGRYRFTWSATGTNSGGFPYTDVVDVWASDPRLIIPLDDARAVLNLSSAQRANDDELRLYIATATVLIEDVVGTLLSETVTEQHADASGSPSLVLRQPVSSITSVTEYVSGVAYPVTSADTPDQAGGSFRFTRDGRILTRRSSGSITRWRGEVWVTYVAGASVVPPNVVLAASELVRHMWSSQRGSTVTGGRNGDVADVPTPTGYAMPNRVMEMLEPSRRAPAVG